MSFFCRSRRPDYTYHDVAQYPLLEHHPSSDERRSSPKHDAEPIAGPDPVLKPNRRRNPTAKELKSSRPSYSVHQDVALAWIDMGCKSSASPSVHACTSGTSPAISKASSKSVVWPLTNSTQMNRMQGDKCSQPNSTNMTSSENPVHNVRISNARSSSKTGPGCSSHRMNISSSASTCMDNSASRMHVHTTTKRSSSQLRNLFSPIHRFTIPSPPPAISFKRRFRVCFGVMSDWQSAVDPKSGRTYYYNAVTRETQWRKPVELATDDERMLMEEKERKQREFFSAMEANIIKSMASGTVASPVVVEKKPSLQPIRQGIVRTISTMDEGTLKDMIKRTPSTRNLMQRSTGSALKVLPLEKIVEAEDMEQSSLDFGNSSMSMFDDSSANLGGSMSEIMALRELAQISREMMSTSGDADGLDISMADGLDMSLGSSLDLNASLELSSQDFMLPEKVAARRARDTSIDSLIYSPEVVDKKWVPAKLEPGEILYTPNVPDPKSLPTDESEDEPNLQNSLKAKPPLVKRNTCGTLYVESTMSAPDKDATIKVCSFCRPPLITHRNALTPGCGSS